MATETQQDKLKTTYDDALCHAFSVFPELLARCEPEAAATIVARLIKTRMTSPPEIDQDVDIMAELVAEEDDDND